MMSWQGPGWQHLANQQLARIGLFFIVLALNEVHYYFACSISV